MGKTMRPDQRDSLRRVLFAHTSSLANIEALLKSIKKVLQDLLDEMSATAFIHSNLTDVLREMSFFTSELPLLVNSLIAMLEEVKLNIVKNVVKDQAEIMQKMENMEKQIEKILIKLDSITN